jgi:thioesterase domain-containing protein
MGHDVALLALLDAAAPTHDGELFRCDPPDGDDPAALVSFMLDLIGCPASAAPWDIQDKRSEQELLLPFFERLRNNDILPSEISAAQFLQWARRSWREASAARSYRPEPYRGIIDVFQARGSARGDASAGNLSDHAQFLGWSSLTSTGVSHHLVPGNHFTMLTEPNVRTLASELTACIERRGGRLK